VSEVAAQVGLTQDAVRYYERLGLLPKPTRSTSGYRQYDEGLTDRLRFIKGAQRFGLRLREIRDLLEVKDRGLCLCGHTQALVTARVAELDQEIARLGDLRGELTTILEDCRDRRDVEEQQEWPCEAEFKRAGGEI
jgi:MerR family mercuric resistance operon transcriptional regulator